MVDYAMFPSGPLAQVHRGTNYSSNESHLKALEVNSFLRLHTTSNSIISQSNSFCEMEPLLCQGNVDLQKDGFGCDYSRLKRVSSGRYKTELCRPFEEMGECKYGEKCQFAHGSHELRQLPRHPKYKTELCRTFHTTGFCPYGPRCHFIHKEEQNVKTSCTTLNSDPPAECVFSTPYIYGGSGVAEPEFRRVVPSTVLGKDASSRSRRSAETYFSTSSLHPQQLSRESIVALAKLLNTLGFDNDCNQNSQSTLLSINRLLLESSKRRSGAWNEVERDVMWCHCAGFSQ